MTSCLVKHLKQHVKHITVSQTRSPLRSLDPFFLSFEYVMIIWLFQRPPLSVSVTSCFTNIMQISSRCCSYHIWGDNRGLCLCPLNKERKCRLFQLFQTDRWHVDISQRDRLDACKLLLLSKRTVRGRTHRPCSRLNFPDGHIERQVQRQRGVMGV